MLKVCVAQAGSVLFDTPATMDRVESLVRRAAAGGARLLVLPEAMLGGYPKGLSFGATVGNRTDDGRELFRRYAAAAITCPGTGSLPTGRACPRTADSLGGRRGRA